MRQLERNDQEPYYPEDSMTDEEYEALLTKEENSIGEYEEWLDNQRRERK